MLTLIAIGLLLLINAFFVAAKFALVKASDSNIARQGVTAGGASRLTSSMHSSLEAYLAACQLGATMATLGLGWLGEPTVTALLEPLFTMVDLPQQVLHIVSFALILVLFASLHVVIGEQVPRALAIRKSAEVSLWVAYPLHAYYLLVRRLSEVLKMASAAIVNKFDTTDSEQEGLLSDTKFENSLSPPADHAATKSQRAELLQSLLEFDQRTVTRIMIPRHAVHTLDVANADEGNRLVAKYGHSRFPLVDSAQNDRVLGIVLAKTVHVAERDGVQDPWLSLSDYAIPPLIVPDGQTITTLFDLMREQRSHLAIILDGGGAFIGIITLEDLLAEVAADSATGQLQAHSHDEVHALARNKWRVKGVSTLSTLERVLGLSVEAATCENSIADTLRQTLSRAPRVGDSVTHRCFVITVTQMKGEMIDVVEMERAPLIGPPAPTHNAATSAATNTLTSTLTNTATKPVRRNAL